LGDDELARVVRDVRLHAEAALLRRLNSGADDARAVYVRDADALARLASGTLRPQGTHRKAAEQIAAELSRARVGATPRLDALRARFHLAGADGALLVTALAYSIDHDTRELVHALAPRRKPALYLDACAQLWELDGAELVRAIATDAALRRHRVLAVDGHDLGAAIELAPSVLAWFVGALGPVPPLDAACEMLGSAAPTDVYLPDSLRAQLNAIVPRVVGDVAIVLRGPRGSGRSAAAQLLSHALDRPRMKIDVPALLAAKLPLASALTVARLHDAIPYLADADALDGDRDAIAALRHHGEPVFVATSGRGHLELGRPQLVVAMPRVELDDRERAWRTALETSTNPLDDAAELAARYVVGPSTIADVVAQAARYARAANVALDRDALEAAVARRLSLRLGSFGTVVARKALFAELVLPDDVIDTLRDMIAMVRERAQILERWGYQRHLGISRGVSAMYSGEPGTGKTMAASVVASELGLELVRIDLSAVVSKYVGETEKNLARIFDEAQDAHAMLLFDEADSLFGKRTELKTAQDRFANLEVNYILQRMESFDGVSVLTTNAESAIDPALQRRLNFRIRFPEPEVDERVRLWRQLLPPATNLHDRVDFAALAERFDMTGGYIKNAVVRAAVIAARAGRAMVAEDLWTGAHHEYVEMGKVMPQLGAP
jgi:hypothetical protein